MNDGRLQELCWDDFNEPLKRIHDRQASAKRFYQKARDFFTLSEDDRAHDVRHNPSV